MLHAALISPQPQVDPFATAGRTFSPRSSSHRVAASASGRSTRRWARRLGVVAAGAVSAVVLVGVATSPSPETSTAVGSYRCMSTACDPALQSSQSVRSTMDRSSVEMAAPAHCRLAMCYVGA